MQILPAQGGKQLKKILMADSLIALCNCLLFQGRCHGNKCIKHIFLLIRYFSLLQKM